MAALPYMQLYVADYLADTMHLSAEEHGAYLLLIMNYWQTGKPIPKSRLHKVARLTNERWTDVEQTLNEFFTDDGTQWVHHRIEADLEAVKEKQKKNQKAGKASGEARKRLKQQEYKQTSNERSTNVCASVQPESNHIEAEAEAEAEAEVSSGDHQATTEKTKAKRERLDQRFDDFWNAYPRKQGKKRARDIWKQKKLDRIADDLIADVKNRHKNDSQWQTEQFIPHGSTYLSKEVWQDEITTTSQVGNRSRGNSQQTGGIAAWLDEAQSNVIEGERADDGQPQMRLIGGGA